MHVTSKSGRRFRLPDAKEDARIQAGIAADPDAIELTDVEMSELRPFSQVRKAPKQAISIRLSQDVLTHFKAEGPGWQTRIDQVLYEYITTHSNK